MKFRFPLQKVVDLKNNERMQAEWLLSKAIGKLRDEQSSLHQLQSEREALLESLTQSSIQAAKISELQFVHQYLTYIEDCIERKHLDVKQAQHQVEHKQNDLTDKMKDEKVWTQVREKAYTQFKLTTMKKEQEQLDEISMIRYINS